MRLEDEIQQKGAFVTEYHKLIPNIFYTASWVTAQVNITLKGYDLTPQQYNVLRILRGQHPTPASVNSIGARMLDKQSNASRIIERLKEKGLVKRVENPADRRAVNVSITEEGLKLISAVEAQEEIYMKGFKTLSPEEAKLLNDLLDKLRG